MYPNGYYAYFSFNDVQDLLGCLPELLHGDLVHILPLPAEPSPGMPMPFYIPTSSGHHRTTTRPAPVLAAAWF